MNERNQASQASEQSKCTQHQQPPTKYLPRKGTMATTNMGKAILCVCVLEEK